MLLHLVLLHDRVVPEVGLALALLDHRRALRLLATPPETAQILRLKSSKTSSTGRAKAKHNVMHSSIACKALKARLWWYLGRFLIRRGRCLLRVGDIVEEFLQRLLLLRSARILLATHSHEQSVAYKHKLQKRAALWMAAFVTDLPSLVRRRSEAHHEAHVLTPLPRGRRLLHQRPLLLERLADGGRVLTAEVFVAQEVQVDEVDQAAGDDEDVERRQRKVQRPLGCPAQRSPQLTLSRAELSLEGQAAEQSPDIAAGQDRTAIAQMHRRQRQVLNRQGLTRQHANVAVRCAYGGTKAAGQLSRGLEADDPPVVVGLVLVETVDDRHPHNPPHP